MAALCDRQRQRDVNHAHYFYDLRQIKWADKMVLPKMHIPAVRGESIPRLTKCIQLLESFISTSPDTINTAAPIRTGLTCSPRNTMPTTNAPTAPMPVQIV